MDRILNPGVDLHKEAAFSEFLAGWQSIVDLVTKFSGAHVGLIMRITNNEIEVFVTSKTKDNPYKIGERERLYGSGLYCEMVIKNKEKVLIPNALKSKQWSHNPDLKYNLLSYLGFPIHNPDGSVFGTLCLLDKKENNFSDDLILMMEKSRDLIESQLKTVMFQKQIADQNNELKNKVQQLKFTNQKLEESEERYRLITDNISDVIWILNLKQQKFRYISPSITRLRGITVEEALAEKIEDSMTKESFARVMEKVENSIENFLTEKDQSQLSFTEIQQPLKNGDLIWVEVATRYVFNENNEVEVVGVSRNIDEREKREAEILRISTHDYLTNKYNRSFFDQRAKEMIQTKERYHHPLSLLMIDLDFFKRVNDNYGHMIGDEILITVSDVTSSVLRKTDILARFGGEEFIVLLPETNMENAAVTAEKIRAKVEETIFSHNIKITISIGVAEHKEGETLDDLYRNADNALYTAKENGRNKVAVHG